MTDAPSSSVVYEDCGVPEGQSLRARHARHAGYPQRRAQVTGGLLAAVATLAPIVLSVRGSRAR